MGKFLNDSIRKKTVYSFISARINIIESNRMNVISYKLQIYDEYDLK